MENNDLAGYANKDIVSQLQICKFLRRNFLKIKERKFEQLKKELGK